MHAYNDMLAVVCIGFVDNLDRALSSLGGIETISQVSFYIDALSHFKFASFLDMPGTL